MSATHDLLIEIGTEEMPASQLKTLSKALGANIELGLRKSDLSYGDVRLFATPRRLGVYIKSLIATQKGHKLEKKGPALKAAFDASGQPTSACLGFAQACGTTVDKLAVQETEKGAWVFFIQDTAEKSTAQLLPLIIQQAISALPVSRQMRWGEHDISFTRPVHWAVLLFGKESIHTQLLGQETVSHTQGHRFHHPACIPMTQADEYEQLLTEKGFVLPNYEVRKQEIRTQLEKIAAPKGKILWDEDLLDEVTGIVEWPVSLLGEFEKQFLELPSEILITVMRVHQKYFPVVNAKNQLQAYFVAVANINSKNPTRVIEGNQRVLRARLSDAQFFYNSDLKQTLESRLSHLDKIIFQKKLGTLLDKSKRISALAGHFAKKLSYPVEFAERAGLLCKADLTTAMVGEFAELQGTMGYYYALHDGEPSEIAEALREHYQPKFAGDELPKSMTGRLVSIADKIDTLVGLFGVNQPPTGEKDPFALRRAALGALRILIECELPLDLLEMLNYSASLYGTMLENSDTASQTFNFMMDRLRAWYLERNISAEVFSSVLTLNPTNPLDFHKRIQAVQHFQTLPQAKSLAAAHKRVSNILKDVKNAQLQHGSINSALLEHESEVALVSLLEQKRNEIAPLYRDAKYTQLLTILADFQDPVDHFFNSVMVMTEDENLRKNRLILLYQLQHLFSQVADISLL